MACGKGYEYRGKGKVITVRPKENSRTCRKWQGEEARKLLSRTGHQRARLQDEKKKNEGEKFKWQEM